MLMGALGTVKKERLRMWGISPEVRRSTRLKEVI